MAAISTARKSFLLRIAWLLIGVGGILLLLGGAFIYALYNPGRWIAEAEGDGLGAVFLAGGFILKSVAEKISDLEVNEKRNNESAQK